MTYIDLVHNPGIHQHQALVPPWSTMADIKTEPDLFQVTAPRQTPYVSKETASFHLQHMVGSVLEQRGLTGCQAGVLVELERMLQDRESSLTLTKVPSSSLLIRRDDLMR